MAPKQQPLNNINLHCHLIQACTPYPSQNCCVHDTKNHSGTEWGTPLLETIITYYWRHKSNALDRKLKPRSVISDAKDEDAGRSWRHQGHAEDYHQPSKSRKENSTRNRAWPRSNTPTPTRPSKSYLISQRSKFITYWSTRRRVSIGTVNWGREGGGPYVFRTSKLQV